MATATTTIVIATPIQTTITMVIVSAGSIDHYDKTVTTATKVATTEKTYGKINCSTCTVEWPYICTGGGGVKTGVAPKTYFLFGKKVVGGAV